MQTRTFLLSLTLLAVSTFGVVQAQDTTDAVVNDIQNSAAADGIDLSVLSFADTALAEIATTIVAAPADSSDISKRHLKNLQARQSAARIDVHAHVAPDWYRNLVPTTGGSPTPEWDMNLQNSFMTNLSLTHSILAFSCPGPNVFQGNKAATVALARLMNEQVAAYARLNPTKFSFYAVVPFPYAAEAITEATYAIKTLGAAGIFVNSNHEGVYLGDARLKPFFQAFNSMGGRQIMYVHPGTPYMHVGNQLIEANPTPYVTGKIEFYFETARTLMDLTLTQTIHNFTNIHYVIPHEGGAYPACIDRILKSYPTLYDSSLTIYRTRFWWDSAGPTFFHQVSGLLGYDIPKSQLLFGTDFPYAPGAVQLPSLQAILTSSTLTTADQTALFSTNAKNLFGTKIQA